MHTLKEQREERDHEDKENTDHTMLDPVEYRYKVIASGLTTNELSRIRVFANLQLRVQGPKEDHYTPKNQSQKRREGQNTYE